MIQLQHNIVSILYSIRSMAESHQIQVVDGCFNDAESMRSHAETALEKIRTQSEKALAITKKLGRLMKTKSRHARRQRVSIKRAWAMIGRRLKQDKPGCPVRLLERIPDRFPVIACDRNDFIEMLYCLAYNAIQAMEGSLTKDSRLIVRAELAYMPEGHPFAVITLADTGPGIEEETLPHLFQPFFTTKSQGKGNGLGLFLTRELALKNRGRVTAMSYRGCGCTFILELPLQQSLSKRRESVAA